MANTFVAQEWVNKNIIDKNIEKMLLSPLTPEEVSWKKNVKGVGGKLVGDLIVQDFPSLDEIGLREHELSSLTVINCPKLNHINVRNNQLTKLDIGKVKTGSDNKGQENEINEIIAGENNLTSLDLSLSSKIKELIVPDNYSLKIEKLNLTSLKNVNLTNTLISLSKENEDLKKENENLYEFIKIIDGAGQDHKFVFTEKIKTSEQMDVAIQVLLKDTEKAWRECFDAFEKKDPNINKKYPLLALCFHKSERRYKGKVILEWIIRAQVDRKYEDLVKKWNDGKDYNSEDDFDGSLNKLMNYLGIRNSLSKVEKYEQK